MRIQQAGASFVGHDPANANFMPVAARSVLRLLERLVHGALTITLPDGSCRRFGAGAPHAEICIADWKVFGAILENGDIGFGESYMKGEWWTPDLPLLLDVVVANRKALDTAIYGSWFGRVVHRLRHVLHRNSRSGSRRNIHAHYDLGNSFYRLWLDDTMTYSSAVFDDATARSDMGAPAGGAAAGDATLAAAQHAKYGRILERLALPAGGRVLEIGCGWGGFAEDAARAGLHVTGVTLSAEQLAWARERLAGAGLAARGDLRFQDYRDITGQYDGIASIEMFEAVGEAWWPTWFDTVKRALKPGGRAVVQTITIDEGLFDSYRKGSDFIQQYIFPGGMLPSRALFAAQARRAGLRVTDEFAFGADYARTLLQWLARFTAAGHAVRALGFDDQFMRMWSFYLAYCAAAFRHGSTDVVQFTLAHDDAAR